MSPRKQPRCGFWGDGRQCRKQGTGNPPLCRDHAEQLGEIDDMDVIVDAAFQRMSDIPQVRSVLAGLGGVIDQFSGLLDRIPLEAARPGSRPPANGRVREAQGHAAAWKARAQEYARRAQEHARRAQEAQQRAATPPKQDPRMVLGLPPGVSLTREVVKSRYRDLAKIYHPDKGGNTEAMQRITAARDELLASIKGP